MAIKTGAGVIPFSIKHGLTCFLFHKTFSGRREGLLVDFGGGGNTGESHAQTASREFIEETEAMFFANNCHADSRPVFLSQYQMMLKLIEETQHDHPNWFCRRNKKIGDRPRDWKTFFVEVDYRDLADMNMAWAEDASGRFKKRRELLWLSAVQLLDIIDNKPEALWKRIREYEGIRDVVLAIDNNRGE